MKCTFCQKARVRLPNHGCDECNNCAPGWTIRYHWEGFATNPTINRLSIYNAVSHIELDFQCGQTRAYKWALDENGKYKLMITLNHIEKIDPATAQQWLDRILKLKAFF